MNADVCDGCLYYDFLADYCYALNCHINEIADYDVCQYRVEDVYD